MDLSTDEKEISNIMVASTEFEVEVRESLSVTEEVKTDKFRLLNIDDLIHIERRFNQSNSLSVRHLKGKPSNYHRSTSQSSRVN